MRTPPGHRPAHCAVVLAVASRTSCSARSRSGATCPGGERDTRPDSGRGHRARPDRRESAAADPAHAVVSATNSLGAHLSARRRVLSFPYLQDATWIAADETAPGYAWTGWRPCRPPSSSPGCGATRLAARLRARRDPGLPRRGEPRASPRASPRRARPRARRARSRARPATRAGRARGSGRTRPGRARARPP